MKTKFTNSEKVSSSFLKIKCDEILQRFKMYDELISESFLQKLELLRMEADHLGGDNYEKLKSLIRLEREFDDYLGSRELFWCFVKCGLELVKDESDWVLRHIFANVKNNLNQEAYKFLDNKFLGKEAGFSFKETVMSLTLEDTHELESMLQEYYRKQFLSEIENDKIGNLFLVENRLRSLGIENHATYEELFVARIYLKTYFEIFDYGEGNELSSRFESFLKEISEDITELCNVCRDAKFWRLLFEFYKLELGVSGDCKDQNEDVSKLFEDFKESHQIPQYIGNSLKVTLKKVTMDEFKEIYKTKMLINLDLRGLDLSDYSFMSGFLIINCNMENTNTYIDFKTINREQFIYYIRGNKVDMWDLTNCCFKGCEIEHFTIDSIKDFRFSTDTFDEEVLEKCGMAIDTDNLMIKELYYRKIMPSSSQTLEEMALIIGVQNLVNRYDDFDSSKRFSWFLLFEKVFPNKINYLLGKKEA